LSIAISSYVHGHRTGYTPFSKIPTTVHPYPNPLPFVIGGVLFGILALLQVRKTIRIHHRRQEFFNRYPQRGLVAPAAEYGNTPRAATGPAGGQVVYPQTGSATPPTAAQNFTYNTGGPANQNANRNIYGNAQ